MIVGITGHQDLGDKATTTWVRSAITSELARHVLHGGLSSLALGADQVFAELLLESRLDLEAVIPCARYEEAFHGAAARARYHHLLSRAARVRHLPFDAPTGQAFLAAGVWIVSHCDLLLAVWNGLPARGLGGTADVVAAAHVQRRPWVHIDPVHRTIDTGMLDTR